MTASRTRFAASVVAILCAGLAGLTMARAAASDQTGRFTMRQTENGMLRLDTLTGSVSICTARNSSWSCVRVVDDSETLDARLRELSAENRKLRDEIGRLRADLEARSKNNTTDNESRRSAIPNEEELDKAFAFLERMLKKFKGLVEDLDEKRPEGTPL